MQNITWCEYVAQ